MKKTLSLILTILIITSLLMGLTSCASSDWKRISEKGYFVCGITLYEPMNYTGEDGELTGFDTELAKMVAAELGVEVKFQLISWSAKYVELSSNSIDCIWNGFTSNVNDDDAPRSEKVDFTYAYLDNAQCVVVKASEKDNYKTAESLSGKKASVESQSAGESYAKSVNAVIVSKTSQKDTFMELKSGSVDFLVVDVLLAKELVGKGDYSDLAIADIEIEKEEYSVGCRKGSDFDEKINEVFVKLVKDGRLQTLADKYGVTVTEGLLNKAK